MNTRDIAALMKAVASVVHAHVGKVFGILSERVSGLEKRVDALPAARDGKDADPAVVVALVDAAVSKAVGGLPSPKDGRDGVDGKDGKSLSLEDVRPLVDETAAELRATIAAEVKTATASIPVPRDGVDGKPGLDGKDGVDGKDGKSLSLEDVRPIMDSAVAEIRAASGEAVSQAIAQIPVPRDGKDGADGESVGIEDVVALVESHISKWALDFERRAHDTLQKAIDRIPAPRDGKDGVDGKDGLGFEDLDFERTGARTAVLRFVRGDKRKEFVIDLPVLLDRGVFKEGVGYEAGDVVTWGGSMWVAQSRTTAKPDAGDGSWRLSVKKGRDGRDGKDGAKGDPGPSGAPGKILRA